MRKWVNLSEDTESAVQINRTIVSIKVKRKKSWAEWLCGCCLRGRRIGPAQGDVSIPEKSYQSKDPSHRLDDSFSISNLLLPQNPASHTHAPESSPQLNRILAHGFNEGEEHPTHERSFASHSQLFRVVDFSQE